MSPEGETLQVSALDMSTLAPSDLTQFWQIPRQNAFLFPVHAMFRHDCPLAVKPASTSRGLVHKKKTWRDSLLFDMLISVVSVLVVAQQNSEFPGGLMNYPLNFMFKNISPKIVPCVG
jgi:hypothetical protein